MILYSSLVGTSTLTIVWFVQPYLVAADLPLVWFGVAWAVLQFSVGFFALIAYRIEAMIGRSSALVSLILLSSGGYFALSQVQALWAAPLLLPSPLFLPPPPRREAKPLKPSSRETPAAAGRRHPHAGLRHARGGGPVAGQAPGQGGGHREARGLRQRETAPCEQRAGSRGNDVGVDRAILQWHAEADWMRMMFRLDREPAWGEQSGQAEYWRDQRGQYRERLREQYPKFTIDALCSEHSSWALAVERNGHSRCGALALGLLRALLWH